MVSFPSQEDEPDDASGNEAWMHRPDRVMRAAVDDFANVIFLRPLVETLRAKAPFTRFAVEAETGESLQRLQGDELDLIVGHCPQLPPGFASRLLARDEMVLAVGPGHPLARLAAKAPLTLADVTRFPHVESQLETARPRLLDSLLTAAGLERRIAISTADYWSASAVARQSDLILSIPSRVLASLPAAGLFALQTDLPVEAIACQAIWHPRLDRDPCLRFVLATLEEIGAASEAR